MHCASCGFVNPEGIKFCGECGTSLTNQCPGCGVENPPQFKFCGECGTSLRAGEQSAPVKSRKRKGTPSTNKATRPAAPATTAKSHPTPSKAERRQLTVMFCDLVDSTALAARLDPEELREVVQAYQQTSAAVIEHYDGRIAQYLGDGLLVYFGYPVAHEDDASRAVRAGLEIVEAIQHSPLLHAHHVQVRVGVHTGPVVVGDIGVGEKREQLALGETPNLAARLQGLAEPDTLVISHATNQLIAGLFICQDLGPQAFKGVSALVQVYRVVSEGNVQSRLEAAVSIGQLTPLVGRANEVSLILERWAAAHAGDGQAILLSGEPGIGKSRLVQEVKAHVVPQGAMCLEFRCSPYYQNSPFHPIITHIQRVLQVERDDPPHTRLEKLRQTLMRYHFPEADTLPLLAALLSLPQPEDARPLTLSPQKQKQRTQEVLVAWVVEEVERAPVYCAWEDLHWADPSTIELLGLLLDQIPTTPMLVLLTARPEFTPPWGSRTHLTSLSLARLPRTQAGEMIEKVTGGKRLPTEVQHQIVSKTDGVPLFVEELTKMVLESGFLREAKGQYELTSPLPPLAIPATLQDSLMARLDRLATVKEVAQVGATLGREFSYELLHAVSRVDAPSLQQALAKLVEAQVLYRRGLPPQARYVFKHALIQDTAYQSLLKSTRQQYHQQIAQALEKQSPEIKETQPELLAHHYTEAGLIEQALPYWQQAGERASQRSAYVEAVAHLTRGLEVLKALSDTPERAQRELALQVAIGVPLIATTGYASPEVEKVYARARTLCQQVGETPQLFPVLWGLWGFHLVRAEYQTARALVEQCLLLAQRARDPALLLEAHRMLGETVWCLGEFPTARQHFADGIALYDPQQHRSLALYGGEDPGVFCRCGASHVLWLCGYPDLALKSIQEALALAQELSHPYSIAFALYFAAMLHQSRRDWQAVQEQTEAAITLATDYGFSYWLAVCTSLRGWARAEQGYVEEGLVQLHQGLAAFRATGAEEIQTYLLAVLAEAHGKVGQREEGLGVLAEALAFVHDTGERLYEAELYRLKGTLTLQSQISSLKSQVEEEAEACFHQAIEIARTQQAKSLELRAVMSLAGLWQQQGKKDKARQMLTEIYGWFTEGFDTRDLQEAKSLLEELT